MKSYTEIANELGVSPQEIHKRITSEFLKQFKDNCTEGKDGCIYLDSEAEDLIKMMLSNKKKASPIVIDCFSEEENIIEQESIFENILPSMNCIRQPLFYRDDMLARLIEKQQDEISAQLEWCDTQIHKLLYKAKNN